MQGWVHSLHEFTHKINQVHSFRRIRTLSPGLLEHLGAGHHGVYQRRHTGTARRNLADFHPPVQGDWRFRVVRIGNAGPAEHIDKHLLPVDGFLLDTHVRLGWILEGSRRPRSPVGEVVRDAIDG